MSEKKKVPEQKLKYKSTYTATWHVKPYSIQWAAEFEETAYKLVTAAMFKVFEALADPSWEKKCIVNENSEAAIVIELIRITDEKKAPE
jgi:hypothetical protein